MRVNKYLKYQAIFVLFFMALFPFLNKAYGIGNGIFITEIMFDPEGSDTKREWIEIHNNSGDDIDLNGWKFYESSVNHSLIFLEGGSILKNGKYAVIVDDKNSFLADYPDFEGMLIDSSYSLSNSGEEIILKNNKGETEFSLSYSLEDGSGNGYSIEYDDERWRTSYTKYGTPGEKPSIKAIKKYDKGLVITELFPNPFKSQYEEYVELFNGSEKDIDLKGWMLHDASKYGEYIFPESLIVEAKKYIAIFKKDFKFALNNSGNESVYLVDPNGETLSSASYDGSKKNVSYNYDGFAWRWSKFLTPGSENLFNNEPYGKIKIPDEIYKNIYADFSIIVKDKDGERTKVVWDFGDGHKSYKNKARHKYEKEGKYEGSVKYSDESEDIIRKFDVEVEKFPELKIKIIQINPNPDGSDTENESIVIENKSKKKVNLIGWNIATGWKKFINHPIRENFVIEKGKIKTLTREICSFTLNNKKDKIELRYPNGNVASKVKYNKEDGIEEGEIYQKISDSWIWKGNTEIRSYQSPITKSSEMAFVINSESLENKINELSVISNQSSDKKRPENKFIVFNNEIIKYKLLKINPDFPESITLGELDGKYIFAPTGTIENHYAVVFAKEIIYALNKELNLLLSYFLS